MNVRTRNRFAAAVAVAATLGSVVLVWCRSPAPLAAGTAYTSNPAGPAKAAPGRAATVEAAHHTAPTPPPASAQSAASAPRIAAAPAETDYLSARSRRWEASSAGQDDLGKPIALVRDASCNDAAFLGQHATMQAVLEQQLGVRTAQDRERLPYDKDRRFFQRDGRFHQITASWDNLQPARYRIEWFSAADPALTADVRAESLPLGTPEQSDAIEAREILAALSASGSSAGQRAGSRFLGVNLAASPSTPAVEAGFINGIPFAVGFEGGSCRVLASGEAAYCQCKSSSTEGDIHGH
jgi:hypothetical protein